MEKNFVPKTEQKVLKTKLLVDSADFWENLKRDIETAESKIYIQTLSFEADAAGRKLSSKIWNLLNGEINLLNEKHNSYFPMIKFDMK